MNVSHVESMLPTTIRNVKQLAVGFVMKCGTTPRGPTLPQKAYEISKSLDFTEDFGISLKISRFHLRFPDFR